MCIRDRVGTLATVFVTFFGAYALSKRTLPLRKTITLIILFTMFFSGGLIPTYLVIQSLHLIDTRWVLILNMLTSAWYMLIARNFLMTIPASLEAVSYTHLDVYKRQLQ